MSIVRRFIAGTKCRVVRVLKGRPNVRFPALNRSGVPAGRVASVIRHDELQRATFEIIRPGRVVDIPDPVSKTNNRRTIQIQAALDEWLAPFYGRGGLVLPIADIQLKVRQFLQASTAAGLPSGWQRNWLRQSFCSYSLAQTGKVTETAREDGHYAYLLERVYLH